MTNSEVLKSEVRDIIEDPYGPITTECAYLRLCLKRIEALEEALRYIREITPDTSVGSALVHRKVQDMFK